MNYKPYTFNTMPIEYGTEHQQPSDEILKNTLGLFRASLEDAVKFGGEFTREVLSTVPLKNDRKNVVVDTKIHMLMKDMCPAIPGWHVDQTPRGKYFSPSGPNPPNIWDQIHPAARPTRFHLLVTGKGCLTDFIKSPLVMNLPVEPTKDLFKIISETINEQLLELKNQNQVVEIPSCTWVTWDWNSLHSAKIATCREWRYLIRVAETDYQEPNKDLREILRQQQNVYIPMEYGW